MAQIGINVLRTYCIIKLADTIQCVKGANKRTFPQNDLGPYSQSTLKLKEAPNLSI